MTQHLITAPYFQTVFDSGALGLANACDPATFITACDALSACMYKGMEAFVLQIHPSTPTQAPMAFDVTATATAYVRFWNKGKPITPEERAEIISDPTDSAYDTRKEEYAA